MNIVTNIDKVYVTIDDVEYEVAENTVDTAEKLQKALQGVQNQPKYKAWLAELEVLLGKQACKTLFKSGKSENIDRIRMIHSGVVMSFLHKGFEIDREAEETQMADKMASVNDTMRMMNEFLRNVNKLNVQDDVRHIKRSE